MRLGFPLTLCFAASIYLVCLLSPCAGQENHPQRTPGALVMGSSPGPALAFPVVLNEPYTATLRTQEITRTSNGGRILREALNIRARDSSGRIRDEQLPSSPDSTGSFIQNVVNIIDPKSLRAIQWNSSTQTFTSADIPDNLSHQQHPISDCERLGREADPSTAESGTVQNHPKYEYLGTRKTEGLESVGCRVTLIIPKDSSGRWFGTVVTETWNSLELRINLLTTENDSDGTVRITGLSDLRRVEPDPSLFQLPTGYLEPLHRP